MRAITLTQPWATLVAIGAKKIESRSWSTSYRGPLAIHAAKGWTKEVVRLAFVEPFKTVLDNAGYKLFSSLPRGAVVATCELVFVREITARQYTLDKTLGWKWTGPDGTYSFELDDQERAFGDYGPSRYAWMLHNIQALAEPIPAKGSLGLWEWNPQEPIQVGSLAQERKA